MDQLDAIKTMIDAIDAKEGAVAIDIFNAIMAEKAADAVSEFSKDVAASMFKPESND